MLIVKVNTSLFREIPENTVSMVPREIRETKAPLETSRMVSSVILVSLDKMAFPEPPVPR